jgi:dihydrofolate reductase
MPRLRAHNLAVSLDGYLAGPGQDPSNPIGVGGLRLHDWVRATRAGRVMAGLPDDPSGASDLVDERFLRAGDDGIGATIIGRNMFGPVRGPWAAAEPWNGWWGEDPPYHHPVFVLTHHPRPDLPMRGGTTFHFVTDGIESALAQSFSAAGGADVRLGGGAATVQEYLAAGLLDELHLAIVPILLGGGERLFDHLDGGPHGYQVAEVASSSGVTHVRLVRS